MLMQTPYITNSLKPFRLTKPELSPQLNPALTYSAYVTSTFCPRCGSPDGDGDLCDRCFAETTDAVEAPAETELRVCSGCGSYVTEAGWTSSDEAVPLEDLALEAAKRGVRAHREAEDVGVDIVVERVDQDHYTIEGSYTASMRGHPVAGEFAVEVRVKRETCPTCGKLSGGYYESIVQVRARNRDPRSRELEFARDTAYSIAGRDYGDRDTFVSRVEEVDGGLDVYMSTNRSGRDLARRVADRYGGSVRDSASLVGMEDGREVHRVTYAVRLPEFVEGDVVLVGGSPVAVTETGDDVEGVDLRSGEHVRQEGEARKIGSLDDVEVTRVVSRGDGEIQVLDPETYETVTLQEPPYLGNREEVPALKTERGVYLIPEELS